MANPEHIDLLNAVLDFQPSMDEMGTPEYKEREAYITRIRTELLVNADLRDADFSYKTICNVNLNGANLQFVSLKGATLMGLDLTGADLSQADLEGAKVSPYTVLENTSLHCAKLAGASFTYAQTMGDPKKLNLRRANFHKADLTGAVFPKCECHLTNFYLAKGLRTTSGLFLRDAEPSAYEFVFPHTERGRPMRFMQWIERITGWDNIRNLGRLPLFSVSYIVALVVSLSIFLRALINRYMGLGLGLLEQTPPHGTNSVLGIDIGTISTYLLGNKEKFLLEISWTSWILVFSTVTLAVASTIYTFACDDVIKTFGRQEWIHEKKNDELHYMSYTWERPLWRRLCAVLYCAGAFSGVIYLSLKLLHVAAIIYANT